MSTLDNILIQKYKEMIGLGNIQNVSNNTTIIGSVSINSDLYVSGTAILNGNTTINSNLYISGNANLLGNVSVGNMLTVLGDSVIQGNTTITSNLYIENNSNISGNLRVSGDSLFNSSVSMMSSLNVSGITQFNNGLYVSDILQLNGNPLNIYGNTINIGNSNSVINIKGSANYVSTTDLKVVDKLISLNLNADTATGFDIGNMSGIEILGTSGTGYIRTDNTATRFEIKPPIGNSGYITTLDMDNNLFVSGTTTLQNDVTMLSSLYVSGNTNIKNSATVSSNLNVSGNTIIQGSVSVNSNLLVSGNTVLLGLTSMNSNLNVSGNSLLNGSLTVNSNLLVNGNMVVNNNTTINTNLYVSGTSIFNGNTTFNSSLYVSGNTLLNGSTTVLGSLYVSGTSLFNNAVSINSNLLVSNNAILYSNTTFNSNLNVSGTSVLQGNITLGSNLSYLTVLGNIISVLPEYNDNASAITAGVPLWGFYRTGGIIKIRLDNIPPVLSLTGGLTISGFIGFTYTDPGVIVSDNLDANPVVSITKIMNNSVNYINNPFIISNTTSTVVSTSISLIVGTYTITYIATDSVGNQSTPVYRTLTITDNTIVRFAGSTLISNNNYINLKNKTESLGFTENVLDSSIFMAVPNFIFSFSAILNRTTLTSYSRIFNINPNQSQKRFLLWYAYNYFNFDFDFVNGNMVQNVGNFVMTNNTNYYFILTIYNNPSSCNIRISLNKDGSSLVFNNTTALSVTVPVDNYSGPWYIGNNTTEIFTGAITNITIASKYLNWSDAFP
jgi:carbonic anhydrase/acetyltransferase-like protein (isoleucine patch superfamily)